MTATTKALTTQKMSDVAGSVGDGYVPSAGMSVFRVSHGKDGAEGDAHSGLLTQLLHNKRQQNLVCLRLLVMRDYTDRRRERMFTTNF